jgi:thioredoxin 1
MMGQTQPGAERPAREDRLRTLSSKTFDALVLEGDGPIAVEFMSYGCAHCRVLEPILQKVAETVQPRATIFRVNIAVEQELADRYQIAGTPTLIMFLDGVERGRSEGPTPTVSNILATMQEPFN